MALKSEYETLMETLEREGKVTKMPPEFAARVREGIKRDLEEYRAESRLKQYQSEQDIMRTVLNA